MVFSQLGVDRFSKSLPGSFLDHFLDFFWRVWGSFWDAFRSLWEPLERLRLALETFGVTLSGLRGYFWSSEQIFEHLWLHAWHSCGQYVRFVTK